MDKSSRDSKEDFVDVPDAVTEVRCAQRRDDEVLLRWKRPRDNGREITTYELRWWPWSLKGESSEAEASASSVTLAAEEVAEGDLCHYPLSSHVRRSVIDTVELLHPAPLRASWVSVRARNEEGWGEWSKASLIFFREVLGLEGSGYGEASQHSTLLTWGASEDGRLGRGMEVLGRDACPELEAVPGFEECRLSFLAAGAHTVVLSHRDRCFLWGSFLPSGETVVTETEGSPDEVDMLVEPHEQALDFVCHAAACGRFCTMLLSAEGRCFAWGPNEMYQCGIPGDEMIRSITELKVPKNEPVIQIELGEFHGLALTASGQVLCWGQDQGPEVGLDATKKGFLPESINFNEPSPRALDVPMPVKVVAAGGYHSAFITENGQLWTWGSNSHGQLGLASPKSCPFVGRPRPLDALKGIDVSKVSLGGIHSAVLDTAGVAYTFGDNRRGQCGQGDLAQVPSPQAVLELPGHVRGVSCGGFFSFFQVGEELYACGWGKEGCLGFGRQSKRQLKVLRVPRPLGGSWVQLRADCRK
eukprot:symbB.v1.2.019695.t1/scaffold1620.1/size227398/7